MKKEITNKQIFSSLIWKTLERFGVQGVSFIVSIVLARMLSPEEYGLIALVTVFINLANVFVQSGFNTALIQKKNTDDVDFSTIFYISVFIAGVLYILLYLSSSTIADFYDQPQLIPVIKVLSTILFFGAINSVQIAMISRKMQFKKLFYSSIGAIVISGISGIILAYMGFGVWALVGHQIINQLCTTIIMWFTVKWKPKLLFSYSRLKDLLSYGWKILVASLVDALYLDLRSLVIGRIYTPDMIGFYNKGKQFPTIIVNNIDGSIQSVMLPTYSSYQDNKKRIKSIVKRSIITSSFIIFPLMIGLAIVSEPLVKIILTSKWLPCVPVLQIYCVIYAIRPILTANIQVIKGLGYSGVFLKIELINKLIGVIILVISAQYGISAIAWGVLLSSVISMFLYTYPNTKLIGYSLMEMIKDIIPALVLTIVMAVIIYPIKFINIPSIALLIIQILIGGIVYLSLALLYKLEPLVYLINTVKGYIQIFK